MGSVSWRLEHDPCEQGSKESVCLFGILKMEIIPTILGILIGTIGINMISNISNNYGSSINSNLNYSNC